MKALGRGVKALDSSHLPTGHCRTWNHCQPHMGGLYPSWGVPWALLVRSQSVLGVTGLPMVALGASTQGPPPLDPHCPQGTGPGYRHPPPQSLVLVPDSFGLFLNNQLQIKVQNLRHPKFPSRGRDSQCWKCSNAGGAHGPPHNIWRWQQSPLSPPSRFRGTRTSPAHLELEMLEPPSTSWGARSPPKTPEDAGTPNREVLRGPQVLTT